MAGRSESLKVKVKNKELQSVLLAVNQSKNCINIFKKLESKNTLAKKFKQIDNVISRLGILLIQQPELFEKEAQLASLQISQADLNFIQSKFHNPPAEPLEIKKEYLGLGEWIATCQYAGFELIYNVEPVPIQFLKELAFGEYDWTQATAIEVLCRLYIDRRVPVSIIAEINQQLSEMRYETHLYLAQALIARRSKNIEFDKIFREIIDNKFHEAVEELSSNR
jgi:hypothetical protein